MTDTERKEVELKPCPIKQVYEQYKHLDHLFSDKEWLKNDDEELGEVGVILPFKQSFYDMWQAIKEYTKRPQDNNTTCPSREEFAKELFNSLGGCVIKETTGHTIYDRWVCAKFGKDNSGMVPRKEYLMCSTHQVGIMPNRLCGYCELERLSQQPPKERKVSLEDIAIELWSLFDTNNEIKWSEIHESLRHFYMIRAQAILSLINATEERKGE